MRTVSFIAAFAILFLGPSIAGNSDTNGQFGIGTFSFSGSYATTGAPMLMAAVR